MEGIKIYKKPRLKNAVLIVAWPGMGEVALKAAVFLVEKLGAQEFAEIPSEEFFYLTGCTVKEGLLTLPQLPSNKFYFYKNKNGRSDIVVFISNAQPDLSRAEAYSRRIIQLAKAMNIKMVAGIASMPQPIEHAQEPAVWGCATSAQLTEILKKHSLSIISESQISGMNGLFLGYAKKEGLEGICLLGEIPFYTIQIENPKASCAVLSKLKEMFSLQLDLDELLEQADAMEGEIDKFLEYIKTGSGGPSPIGEDEIEKIKNTLNQLTHLPISVKDKIEKLFEESKKDLTRAYELKLELDKWNVYKEYEDRFLDLFRKSKGKGN